MKDSDEKVSTIDYKILTTFESLWKEKIYNSYICKKEKKNDKEKPLKLNKFFRFPEAMKSRGEIERNQVFSSLCNNVEYYPPSVTRLECSQFQ